MTLLPHAAAAAILRWWGKAPNDGTSFPWWAITVTSKIGERGEIMLAGPFFSRENAQNVLNAHRYRYPKRAHVYCFSGHESPDLRMLYDIAKQLAQEET